MEEQSNQKRKNRIYTILIVLCASVAIFSAAMLLHQHLKYKKAQQENEKLRQEYVQETYTVEQGEDKDAPLSVPETEPAGQEETKENQDPSYWNTSNQPDKSRRPIREGEIKRLTNPNPYTKSVKVDFEALKAVNSEVVAWLYGMDGIVNYPVVQGTDNEYYNHRLLDGRQQFCGTLFVDYRNDFLKDDLTIIYGHKMKDGTMFGHFGKYDTYAYYQTHPTFTLETPDATYELQVIACVYTDKWEPQFLNFESEEHFNAMVANYRRRSTFQTAVDVEYGDSLVALWTCAYYIGVNGRMFILCKAVQIR